MLRFTKGPWEQVMLNDGSTAFGMWNLPASFIGLIVAAILYRGMKESAFVNNLIVVIKVDDRAGVHRARASASSRRTTCS